MTKRIMPQEMHDDRFALTVYPLTGEIPTVTAKVDPREFEQQNPGMTLGPLTGLPIPVKEAPEGSFYRGLVFAATFTMIGCLLATAAVMIFGYAAGWRL